MDLLHLVLIAQIFLSGEIAGQKITFLYNESVYTIPHFPQSYDNATDSCSTNHDGELESIQDPSQKILALGFKDFQTTGKIWTTENLDDYGEYGNYDEHRENQCTSFQLVDGSILKEDCNLQYYSVCKAKAWRYNISTFEDHKYALSEAKLRYTDSAKVCREKGIEDGVEGTLVTIHSEAENDFLKNLINEVKEYENTGNNVEYFIQRGNSRGTYTNWLRPPTAEDATECIIISDSENPGKWQAHSCYDYKNFICKWPRYRPTTQASLKTTTMKEAPTTTAGGNVEVVVVATSATTNGQKIETTTSQQEGSSTVTNANGAGVTEGQIEYTTGGAKVHRQELMIAMTFALAATIFAPISLG